jgi:hypothetical protein
MACELGSKVQISQDAHYSLEQNFSSPARLPKLITPKPSIVSGCVNDR